MKLKLVGILIVSYVLFTLVYSFIGFLSFSAGGQPEQYTLISFVEELGGHFLFGALAAIPFLSIELIFLTASTAVLIDFDHLLRIFGLQVGQRPDHAISFIVFSAAVLYLVARRMDIPRSTQVKILFVTPVAVLSHFSYDIFAAFKIFNGGNSFPLFSPFDTALIPFPYWTFGIFEIAATTIAIFATILSSKYVSSMERRLRSADRVGSVSTG